MSGGDLVGQDRGGHQVVIITFAGELTEEEVRAWNEALSGLKRRLGPKVMAVTIKGERSRLVG